VGLLLSPQTAEPGPDRVAGRRQALAIGLFSLFLLGILAVYLYATGPLRQQWLEPHVVMPTDLYDEPFLVFNALVLLWLPLLFTWWGLGEEPTALGFARGDWRAVWRWVAGGYAVMLVAVFVVGQTAPFQQAYPLRQLVRWDPRYLLYYELTYGFYFFCWEWFFRGFLLFGLARGWGRWAIVLQAIPFGLLHWGKPTAEVLGSFVAGLFLGELALRARSFLPGFALHWAVATSLDLWVLLTSVGRLDLGGR
jgi:membrane protease YdiL (CAAX protease family)